MAIDIGWAGYWISLRCTSHAIDVLFILLFECLQFYVNTPYNICVLMDCASLLIFSYICISQLTFVAFHNYLLWHFTTNFCGISQLTFVVFYNFCP